MPGARSYRNWRADGSPTIKRRLGRLENVFVVDRLQGCPLLTADEIDALAGRLTDGQRRTDEEKARIIRQCPIIQAN